LNTFVNVAVINYAYSYYNYTKEFNIYVCRQATFSQQMRRVEANSKRNAGQCDR